MPWLGTVLAKLGKADPPGFIVLIIVDVEGIGGPPSSGEDSRESLSEGSAEANNIKSALRKHRIRFFL